MQRRQVAGEGRSVRPPTVSVRSGLLNRCLSARRAQRRESRSSNSPHPAAKALIHASPVRSGGHRTIRRAPPRQSRSAPLSVSVTQASKRLPFRCLPGCMVQRKTVCPFVALHETLRRSKGSDPNRWPKQFQGQSWGQRRSRKPRCRIYLAFSCGEVAERLKAAVC